VQNKQHQLRRLQEQFPNPVQINVPKLVTFIYHYFHSAKKPEMSL
jgi:hypothetical protein